MEHERAIELLRSSGALLGGHFLLTSGNHSGRYIQCAALLSRPEIAVEFMEEIAEQFKGDKVETVVAPAVGGIIVAYEVARLLGARALFFERVEGKMTLRRGFHISEGERVLIVEDVITTGGSVLEVRDTVEVRGGTVAGLASIVNRSGGRFEPGVSYYYCIKMEIPIYSPESCPFCKTGSPVVKPGSRGLK
ncbi:MAG TPA: orotate phosphoribosyltransferase [Spirochaetota bacterium]|nr:orotate phosphoribosyltransferase [Spirochaetota bacterium]